MARVKRGGIKKRLAAPMKKGDEPNEYLRLSKTPVVHSLNALTTRNEAEGAGSAILRILIGDEIVGILSLPVVGYRSLGHGDGLIDRGCHHERSNCGKCSDHSLDLG